MLEFSFASTAVSIAVTPFGYLMLGAVVAVFFVSPSWSYFLLCAAALLQAFTPLVIAVAGAKYGVPINLFVGPVVCAALFLRAPITGRVHDPMLSLATRVRHLTPSNLPAIFLVYVATTALVLPSLFSGLPVMQMLGNVGLHDALQPLRPNLNHAVQIAHAFTLLMVVLASWRVSKHYGSEHVSEWILVGLVGAVLLSAVVTWTQSMIAPEGVTKFVDWFGYNPSYGANYYIYHGGVLGGARYGLPLSEPSYTSAIYASTCVGAFAVFLGRKRKRWLWGVVGCLTFCSLLLTGGRTGIFALLFSFALATTYMSFLAVKRSVVDGIKLSLVSNWVVMSIAFVLLCVVFAKWLAVGEYAGALWKSALIKVEELSFISANDNARGIANLRALTLLLDTYGLGVGAGSHRAAGYFFSLLANLGLIGTALFAATLYQQLVVNARIVRGEEHRDSTVARFYLGSIGCMTIAAAAAIPDILFPAYWILLLLGFTSQMMSTSQASAH